MTYFSILGDSISTLAGYVPSGWRTHYESEVHVEGVTSAENTWWGQVIMHFNGALLGNSSFSGSMVEGFGFPAGNSERRIDALGGADGATPDVVLVFMGINDYGWGTPRNQVLGGSLSASAAVAELAEGPNSVQMTVDDSASASFESAYACMLRRVKARAPEAQIWCATLCAGSMPGVTGPHFAYCVRGVELEAYNRAIRHAAQMVGAQVADLAAFNIEYDAVDGVHPSALGMKQLACMFISCMEGKTPGEALASNDVLANAPVPQRVCFRKGCEGCAFNTVTPESWGLFCPNPERPDCPERS